MASSSVASRHEFQCPVPQNAAPVLFWASFGHAHTYACFAEFAELGGIWERHIGCMVPSVVRVWIRGPVRSSLGSHQLVRAEHE